MDEVVRHRIKRNVLRWDTDNPRTDVPPRNCAVFLGHTFINILSSSETVTVVNPIQDKLTNHRLHVILTELSTHIALYSLALTLHLGVLVVTFPLEPLLV